MILITAILNDQFNKLVKVTLKEKQALTDDKNDIQVEVMDESAKSLISFAIIISLIIQSESSLQLE